MTDHSATQTQAVTMTDVNKWFDDFHVLKDINKKPEHFGDHGQL